MDGSSYWNSPSEDLPSPPRTSSSPTSMAYLDEYLHHLHPPLQCVEDGSILLDTDAGPAVLHHETPINTLPPNFDYKLLNQPKSATGHVIPAIPIPQPNQAGVKDAFDINVSRSSIPSLHLDNADDAESTTPPMMYSHTSSLLNTVNGGHIDRWLQPQEIYDVLTEVSASKYTILRTSVHMKPPSGSVFLFDRSKVKFRKDGYDWEKRSDGRTVREDHAKLKVGGKPLIYSCYAHLQANSHFHRRCCWLLSDPRIVIVFYLNTEGLTPGRSNPIRRTFNDRNSSIPMKIYTAEPSMLLSNTAASKSSVRIPFQPTNLLPKVEFDVFMTGNESNFECSKSLSRSSVKSHHQNSQSEIDYYCPNWAPANVSTQVVLIGNFKSHIDYECYFGEACVPTCSLRDGVLLCNTPPLQNGLTTISVRCKFDTKTLNHPFEVRNVILNNNQYSKSQRRHETNLSKKADEREKDLRDITWKDFVLQKELSKLEISGSTSEELISESRNLSSKSRQKQYAAARTIQHAFRRYMEEQKRRKAVAVIEDSYKKYKYKQSKREEAAAVKIQSNFRAHVARQDFLSSRRAAILVQQCFRQKRSKNRGKLEREDEAARKIQKFMNHVMKIRKSCRTRTTSGSKSVEDIETETSSELLAFLEKCKNGGMKTK